MYVYMNYLLLFIVVVDIIIIIVIIIIYYFLRVSRQVTSSFPEFKPAAVSTEKFQ